MLDKGVKIIFKPKKIKKTETLTETEDKTNSSDFQTILGAIVNDQKDPYLVRAYELIVNGKDVSTEDVMFL